MQPVMNTSLGLHHQNQTSNESNQQVNQIRMLQSPGQSIMSIPRQPMQRPTHMQQIQVNAAGQQVRMSQSQFYQQGMFPVRYPANFFSFEVFRRILTLTFSPLVRQEWRTKVRRSPRTQIKSCRIFSNLIKRLFAWLVRRSIRFENKIHSSIC